MFFFFLTNSTLSLACSNRTRKHHKSLCRQVSLFCDCTCHNMLIAFLSPPLHVSICFSGGDIQLIEFRPPTLEFIFQYAISIPLYTDGAFSVTLELFPFAYVTLDVAIVLDTKGIREAVQEMNPLKAISSFALRDLVDGVDLPLVTIVAGCEIGVSAG
jgi:hypothetical protein